MSIALLPHPLAPRRQFLKAPLLRNRSRMHRRIFVRFRGLGNVIRQGSAGTGQLAPVLAGGEFGWYSGHGRRVARWMG
jgi:hypothetical protein